MRRTSEWRRFTLLAACATLIGSVGCETPADPSSLSARRHAPASPFMSRSPDGTEVGYYNGVVYRWQFPSGTSNDQRELFLPDCFNAGPDFTQREVQAGVGSLYAIFLPSATQHMCPDGSDLHDHVLSAVPGQPGGEVFWDLKEVWPGPNYDPSLGTLTSEEAILSAASHDQVIIIDDQIVLHAVVLGPVR